MARQQLSRAPACFVVAQVCNKCLCLVIRIDLLYVILHSIGLDSRNLEELLSTYSCIAVPLGLVILDKHKDNAGLRITFPS